MVNSNNSQTTSCKNTRKRRKQRDGSRSIVHASAGARRRVVLVSSFSLRYFIVQFGSASSFFFSSHSSIHFSSEFTAFSISFSLIPLSRTLFSCPKSSQLVVTTKETFDLSRQRALFKRLKEGPTLTSRASKETRRKKTKKKHKRVGGRKKTAPNRA